MVGTLCAFTGVEPVIYHCIGYVNMNWSIQQMTKNERKQTNMSRG